MTLEIAKVNLKIVQISYQGFTTDSDPKMKSMGLVWVYEFEKNAKHTRYSLTSL